MLADGVAGVLSDAACVFTFVLKEGLSFVGEPGLGLGVAGTLALSETEDPVLRTAGALVFSVAEPVGVELPARPVLAD